MFDACRLLPDDTGRASEDADPALVFLRQIDLSKVFFVYEKKPTDGYDRANLFHLTVAPHYECQIQDRLAVP